MFISPLSIYFFSNSYFNNSITLTTVCLHTLYNKLLIKKNPYHSKVSNQYNNRRSGCNTQVEVKVVSSIVNEIISKSYLIILWISCFFFSFLFDSILVIKFWIINLLPLTLLHNRIYKLKPVSVILDYFLQNLLIFIIFINIFSCLLLIGPFLFFFLIATLPYLWTESLDNLLLAFFKNQNLSIPLCSVLQCKIPYLLFIIFSDLN